MSQAFLPRELPDNLIKRQNDLSDGAFAKTIGLTRQYYSMVRRGIQLPSAKMLDGMGLERVLRVRKTGKLFDVDDIGTYLRRLQGKKGDAEIATECGLTRQHYYSIRERINATPTAWALEQLGLELLYRPKAKKKAA